MKSRRFDEKYVLRSDFHYNNQNTFTNQSFQLNEKDKNDIIEEVLKCIRLDDLEKKDKQSVSKPEPQEKALKPSNVKFPPPITKSGFPNNLSDQKGDSYFRFFNIQADSADFDFCGNNIERAKANKTELEQACDILGSAVDAYKIENLEKGTVSLRDGKWEVTQKAKIKFV